MTHDLALHPGMTVGTVAELHPATRPVFTRHGIDLCCGSRRSLEFVALAHGLDLAGLLTELEAARAG
jgi:iron-sulfur cluster repair protein YtfE (RIC family)